jgi:multiple antibiotic resistance protein
MLDLFITAFVTFFVVIDPPGVAPVFAGLTENMSPGYRRVMAWKSVFVAALILLGFAYGGEWLLNQLHVSLDAFRIAGGVLLFLIALDMLFERRQERRERSAGAALSEAEESQPPPPDVSVFPLAIPMIAGPGAVASVLLHMNEARHQTSYPPAAAQIAILAAIAVNLAFCLVLFLASAAVSRLLGRTVRTALERILGLVLAALSVQFIIDGVRGALA